MESFSDPNVVGNALLGSENSFTSFLATWQDFMAIAAPMIASEELNTATDSSLAKRHEQFMNTDPVKLLSSGKITFSKEVLDQVGKRWSIIVSTSNGMLASAKRGHKLLNKFIQKSERERGAAMFHHGETIEAQALGRVLFELNQDSQANEDIMDYAEDDSDYVEGDT